MSTHHIVDTNVPIVANNREENTRSAACVLSCTNFLVELMSTRSVVIDLHWEVLGEYMHLLRSAGQPGIGDAFLKWVLTNQANPNKVTRLEISGHKLPDEIESFDPADHKWLLLGLARPATPIAQASDSLWWKRRTQLQRAGILIEFLCPEEIAELSDRKHGPSAYPN
ncbi:hypothetical protein [Streptomyces sp. NPDC091219]|uniref:hypothetical protein n=1 Tax=Streptomyces sp. NPDC091219 TaxID=3155193 RepID=UPI00344B235C